jgi:hypothetical protein
MPLRLRRTPPVLAMGLHRRPSSPPKSKYASAWQPGACEFPQWESTWETAGSLVGIHRDSLNSSRQSQRHAASSRSCESLHRQGPTGGYRYYGSLEEDRYYGSLEEDSSQGELIWAWPHVEGVGTGDVCNGRATRQHRRDTRASTDGWNGVESVCRCALAMCSTFTPHVRTRSRVYVHVFCVCRCVCRCVCACIHICVCSYVHVHVCMCPCICLYAYMYVHAYMQFIYVGAVCSLHALLPIVCMMLPLTA